MVSKIGKMEHWSDGVMECWRKENFGFQISDFKYLAHPINPICNLYPGNSPEEAASGGIPQDGSKISN